MYKFLSESSTKFKMHKCSDVKNPILQKKMETNSGIYPIIMQDFSCKGINITSKDELQRSCIVWTMFKKCVATAINSSCIWGWALIEFRTWRTFQHTTQLDEMFVETRHLHVKVQKYKRIKWRLKVLWDGRISYTLWFKLIWNPLNCNKDY